MTRSEIIDLVVVRAAPEEQQSLRQTLSTYTTVELQQIEKAIISQEVSKKADEDLIRIQADRVADHALHQYHTQKAREPQREAEEKAQLVKDRQTFTEAAKTLRTFGVTEANFNVCRTTLGENFSAYEIEQMLAANGAILSGPTQQELDEWTRQDVEAHNLALLSADLPTLRRLTREAGANAAQAGTAMDQVQTVRAAEKSQNNQFQPLLPDSRLKGEIIDLELVQQLDSNSLKQLIRIYGADAINARIREWNSKVQRNLY